MKKYYMHTINGKPAFVDPVGGSICYASLPLSARHHNILVQDLKTIKAEQAKDREYANPVFRKSLGYIVVYIPDQPREHS